MTWPAFLLDTAWVEAVSWLFIGYFAGLNTVYVALNLVARPAIDETVLRTLGQTARHNGDTLLGLLTDAQLADAQRHRRWAAELVRMALEQDGNRAVLAAWIDKWAPLADAAIDAYCDALPDAPDAAARARAAVGEFRRGIGL